MDKNKSDYTALQAQNAKRMALVSVQAGCLTFFMAGIALLIGLWLDSRLGTAPRWTLIILLSSAPLAFGGVFWLIRRALRHIRSERGQINQSDQPNDYQENMSD